MVEEKQYSSIRVKKTTKERLRECRNALEVFKKKDYSFDDTILELLKDWDLRLGEN